MKQKSEFLLAFGSLTVVTFYLIAQMVGAGKLIELLFGMDYGWSVVIVGALMIVYVTLVVCLQLLGYKLLKAVLLLSGVTFIAVMVLFTLWILFLFH